LLEGPSEPEEEMTRKQKAGRKIVAPKEGAKIFVENVTQ
jgi:hypothetical protein